MLPLDYNPQAIILFEYWEKKFRRNLVIAFPPSFSQYYHKLTSKKISEPFIVGLN